MLRFKGDPPLLYLKNRTILNHFFTILLGEKVQKTNVRSELSPSLAVDLSDGCEG